MQRSTFKDDDHIRVHPIITKGGDLVNVIPADVRIETYVEEDPGSHQDANRKVTRALRAGADAVGARWIVDIPGYLPRLSNDMLDKVFRENAERLVGEDMVIVALTAPGHPIWGYHASDSGDSPVAAAGQRNRPFQEFVVDDPDRRILPAKLLALTAVMFCGMTLP